MDYVTSLKTCSEEVRAAIKRLEEIVVRFERRKYSCGNALYFYVLSKVKSPLLKEFLDASKRGWQLGICRGYSLRLSRINNCRRGTKSIFIGF